MEPPEQVHPTRLADYFEVLTKAVFQSGMSWKVVEAKWPGFPHEEWMATRGVAMERRRPPSTASLPRPRGR